MKKSKLYLQIGLAIVLTLACILFCGGTIYFYKKNNLVPCKV